MLLVSFVIANASASALYADCLAEGTTEYKLFNLVGIFSGAFHPFVISCLCLMMMYMVLLLEAYRVWKARHGEDNLGGALYEMIALTEPLALIHSLWPLFNLFIWVFSLAFVFSLSFLPSFLLLAGIMYVWLGRPSRLSASLLGGSDRQRQMEEKGSWIFFTQCQHTRPRGQDGIVGTHAGG
jgi:hypothetical protein